MMLRTILLATAAMFGLATPSLANQITAFGQSSGSNTVAATVNGADTQTTLSATDAVIGITQIFGGVPIAAFFDLNATSTDSVSGVGNALLQHFSGNFSLTSGPGGTGVNFLSGTFTDAAFGVQNGTQLSVNVASPPDTLSLTSSVIPVADLNPPSSFTLAFSNVTPGLGEIGTTLAPFTASFSGVANAAVEAVPEPAPLALMGVGLLGLTLVRWRRA